MKKDTNLNRNHATSDELTMRVYHEYDYTKFIKDPSINRDVKSERIKIMRESLKTIKACTRPIVVVVKGDKFLIIDGQSLFEALRLEGLQIPYIIINPESKEDMMRVMAFINSSYAPWQLENFVHMWTATRVDYRKLQRYHESSKLPYPALVAMAMNEYTGKVITDIIKNGDFSFTTNEGHFNNILKYALEYLKLEGYQNYTGRGRIVMPRLSTILCGEVARYYYCHEKYDHDVIKARLARSIVISHIRKNCSTPTEMRIGLQLKVFK